MTQLDLEADAAAIAADAAPNSEIGALAAQATALEQEIADAEEALKDLKARHKTLVEVALPEAMDSANCSIFGTPDGYEIEVANVLHASISKAREAEAFQWLREHGHEDLIKNELKVSLGRGDDDKAAAVRTALADLGLTPDSKQTVHANTLAAFCREQMEQGVSLPSDLLGIDARRVAKIKQPKGRKK